jgi:hypothetical protein
MRILVDEDLKGDVELLWGALAAGGWSELLPIALVTFEQVGLPGGSDDRNVWRFAQRNQMILLTANRNMKGDGSLERTLREENSTTSLPVVTVSRRDSLRQRDYRAACVERLVEIVMYVDVYRGASRIFIP